jgi:ESS family glutamate:Na+ symporter
LASAPLLTLDLVQTLALAGCVLFLGYGVRRLLPALARVNVPAPVVGGLLAASLVWWGRSRGLTLVQLDTTLQAPLMIAFFTTIGFGASLSLLRAGGPAVALFLGISTVLAVGQNVLGAVLAPLLGQHPLLGVLAGSVTLTGGPATGLAFAPLFEKAGVSGAATLAVAAAMAGIVSGGLLGGPLGTWLIRRHALRTEAPGAVGASRAPSAGDLVEANEPESASADVPSGEDPGGHALLRALVAILVAMWVGSWLSAGFTRLGLTLPAYIGAMLAAAALRNLDDASGLLRLSHRLIDDLGNAALALFLALALTTLKLWELAGLALPLAVLLAAQVALVALACVPVYRLMGRDYDAAVMSGGFCGFMLGTTANAMANMGALVERYGPAPRAYLVVPLVGAFFIDFTNALLITAFLNFWR